MAFADNALFGIKSLDDLLKLEIPPGDEELELRFKGSALNRSILRTCIKEKGTVEEKWPKSPFLRTYRVLRRSDTIFVAYMFQDHPETFYVPHR